MRSPAHSPYLPVAAALSVALIGAVLARCGGDSASSRAAQLAIRARGVVLISIDTLRQDHLGCYGYPRPTSPNLDYLASRGVRYTNAMAQAPYTLPSTMTMLTGLHPRAHGVRYTGDKLGDAYTTLAEVLRAEGFRTAAFTDGGFTAAAFGFDQGFELYDDDTSEGVSGLRRTLPLARAWLDRHAREPFFLFLHTFDTHAPYRVDEASRAALQGTAPVVPPGAAREGDPMAYLRRLRIHDYFQLERYDDLGEIIDDYDAMIRFVDRCIGDIIGGLERQGVLDETLIVVTTDHGESFLDHGLYMGHGLTMYNEEVRVPLLVKFPGDALSGTVCDDVVRLLDLAPTALAATRSPALADSPGLDLALAARGLDAEPRIAYGESPNLARPDQGPFGSVVSYARRKQWKFIESPALSLQEVTRAHLHRGEPAYDHRADPLGLERRYARERLIFDLDADPLELWDLGRDNADLLERIALSAREIDFVNSRTRAAKGGKTGASALGADELRRLVELGYLSATDLAPPVEAAAPTGAGSQQRSSDKD